MSAAQATVVAHMQQPDATFAITQRWYDITLKLCTGYHWKLSRTSNEQQQTCRLNAVTASDSLPV